MTEKSEAAGANAVPSPSFEESLERLETIVEELEGGSLTLEQSIARYEEGVRLQRRLTQRLDEAEKTIERLIASENGGVTTEPMDLESENRENPGPSRTAVTRPASRAGGSSRPPSAPEPDELPF